MISLKIKRNTSNNLTNNKAYVGLAEPIDQERLVAEVTELSTKENVQIGCPRGVPGHHKLLSK